MTGYGPPPGPPAGPPSGPPNYGPPPGGGGGYGPPQNYGGGPGGPGGPAKPAFDPKSVNPQDWGILGAAVLAFIFSFISFYTYNGKGEASAYSQSDSAWTGFFGWFAVLLAIIGAAAVAVAIFAPTVKLPLPNRLLGLIAFAIATISILLALITVPDYNGGGTGYDQFVDEGHGFGYWATLVFIVVGLVLSFLRFQQSGGSLNNLGSQLTGGHSGGPGAGAPAAPYAQPGYGTPQPQAYQPPPAPQAPPSQGPPPQGYQAPPQQGGYQQGPPPQGYQAPPQQGGYQQGPPPQGYQQQPPPGYTPPPQ